MGVAEVIILAGALVFIAHFFSWLFSFTKIPNVVLLMGIGLLLGPFFGWLTPEFFGKAGDLVIGLALAIIFFEAGIKLKIVSLVRAWRNITLLSIVSFIFSSVSVGILLIVATDLHPILAFTVGVIMGDNAAALVTPLLDRLTLRAESRATIVLESAFSGMLSIIITLALLRAYEIGVFAVERIMIDIVVHFTVATAAGIFFALLWATLLNKVHRMRYSTFTTPAFVFILFGAMEALDFSGLIAVLAFGITLGNIPLLQEYLREHHRLVSKIFYPTTLDASEKALFSEIAFVFQTFFFVFIGLSITFADRAVLVLSLGLTIALVALRSIAVRLVVAKDIPSLDVSIMTAMIPRGLATAVLGTLALQRGFEGGALIQEITYSVVLWSIVLTSLLVFLFEKTPAARMYGKMIGRGNAYRG